MATIPSHPRLDLWLEVGGLIADAAEAGVKAAGKRLRARRRGAFTTLRPGADTPLWNACAARMRDELRPHGAKTRMARYLGIPKQRLHDYLKAGSRMPDAETLLRMLNWLAHKQAGRDVALAE